MPISELLLQYLVHEDNMPTNPITEEWKAYWKRMDKNPNKDSIPEMFTEEFHQYCREKTRIWLQLTIEDKKQYWDLLKEKNYDQWRWSSNNPEGNCYDPLWDAKSGALLE